MPEWVLIKPVKNINFRKIIISMLMTVKPVLLRYHFETDHDHLILDDAAASKFAEKLGLPVKGTMGLLLSAKQQNIIPLVRAYIDLIQKFNFRVSQSIIDNILLDAGEY